MQQQQREMNFKKTMTTTTATLCFQGSFLCVCTFFHCIYEECLSLLHRHVDRKLNDQKTTLALYCSSHTIISMRQHEQHHLFSSAPTLIYLYARAKTEIKWNGIKCVYTHIFQEFERVARTRHMETERERENE